MMTELIVLYGVQWPDVQWLQRLLMNTTDIFYLLYVLVVVVAVCCCFCEQTLHLFKTDRQTDRQRQRQPAS